MAPNWEDTFRQWAQRSSDNEDNKRNRTEKAIREACDKSSALRERKVTVFAKGSYANNTNVRQDSDVDIAVRSEEFIHYELIDSLESKNPLQLGIDRYAGGYTERQFKADVEAAMVQEFGRSSVDRGNKAIEVHESSRFLAADVVPCFRHYEYYSQTYTGTLLYREGIVIYPDSGGSITNWPVQTHENGNVKNNATGRRYKRVVRILKRLENQMVEEGIISEVPSFLIESLVYNVPNSSFNHLTYTSDVRSVLAHLFNNLRLNGQCDEWVEVNNIKYLFRRTQKWTQAQAFEFVDKAWDYLGFE